MTSQNITAQSLLSAIRAGKLTAEIYGPGNPLGADAIPPLASGDSGEQYPRAEILLKLDGETLRTVPVWKYVYRCRGNDPLTGEQILPQGSWQTRTASSDGATRGTPVYHITAGADENNDEIPEALVITTGEGCGRVEPLDLCGLTMEEAEEIAQEIGDTVEAAYSEWEPEDASDEEIYDALTEDGRRVESVDVSADIGGETVSVRVYGATHCDQPVYAMQDDEEQEVFPSPLDAVTRAKSVLRCKLLTAIETLDDIDTSDLAEQLRQITA